MRNLAANVLIGGPEWRENEAANKCALRNERRSKDYYRNKNPRIPFTLLNLQLRIKIQTNRGHPDFQKRIKFQVDHTNDNE